MFGSQLLGGAVCLCMLSFSARLLCLVAVPCRAEILNTRGCNCVKFTMSLVDCMRLVLSFNFVLSNARDIAMREGSGGCLSRLFAIVAVCGLVYKVLLVSMVVFLYCDLSSFCGSGSMVLVCILTC